MPSSARIQAFQHKNMCILLAAGALITSPFDSGGQLPRKHVDFYLDLASLAAWVRLPAACLPAWLLPASARGAWQRLPGSSPAGPWPGRPSGRRRTSGCANMPPVSGPLQAVQHPMSGLCNESVHRKSKIANPRNSFQQPRGIGNLPKPN